jgi:uncharacterized phage protein gp47/JayE
MATSIPTLVEIIERAEADIKFVLNVPVLIKNSFEKAVAKAVGGLAFGLYKYSDWVKRQMFITTCDDEFIPRHATIWDVARVLGSNSRLNIIFAGNIGSVIPVDTIIQYEDLKFKTESEATFTVDTITVSVVALQKGSESNLDNGTPLLLINSISGVDAECVTDSVLESGTSDEAYASWRERIHFAIRNPASGGAAPDYIQEAKSLTGITRAWVFPLINGPNTVGLKFVQDNDVDIIPSASRVSEIQNHFESWIPVGAILTVSAPAVETLDLEIRLVPNTTEVQDAVREEIREYIYSSSQVRGAWAGPNSTYDGKILISKLNEAISKASGEEDHEITQVNGSASFLSEITPPDNYLITLGAIAWTS